MTVVTAQPEGSASQELPLRIASSLILGPVALAAVWFGALYFVLLVALMAAILGWEWRRLCSGQRYGVSGVLLSLFCLAAVAAIAVERMDASFIVLAAGLVVMLFLEARESGKLGGWLAAGVIYIGVPSIALIWLRDSTDDGRYLLIWLLAAVWATDIGAYAAGRMIGGPKLAPRVSPNKTWAGLVGGVVCAAAVGAGMSQAIDVSNPTVFVIISGFIAVAAQGGDLLESSLKRHFGVKDVSQIIPGHGGVMDRVDGLVVAAPIVAGLVALGQTGYVTWM